MKNTSNINIKYTEKNHSLSKQNMNPRGFNRGGMGMPAEKPKDFKGTLKRLINFLKPQKKTIILMIIIAMVSTVFAIVAPKLIAQKITNPLIYAISTKGADTDWNLIISWIVIITVIYVLSSFFAFLSNYMSVKMAQSVVYKLRSDVKAKLDKLPLKYFDNSSTGNTLSIITNDIDTISNTLQQSINQIITSVITIIGVFIMMLTISVWMSLITLVSIPAVAHFNGIIM